MDMFKTVSSPKDVVKRLKDSNDLTDAEAVGILTAFVLMEGSFNPGYNTMCAWTRLYSQLEIGSRYGLEFSGVEAQNRVARLLELYATQKGYCDDTG